METLQDGSIRCTTKELSIFWGVNLRTVQRAAQEGIISKTSESKNAKFDLQDSTKRYISHLSDRANGRIKKQSEAEWKEKKLIAETALKESQAELHKMRTEIAGGKFLSIEEVKLDYAKFFVIFKKFAQGLSGRLMSYINGYINPVEARDVEMMLSKDIDNALRSFVVAGMKEGDVDSEEKQKSESKSKTTKSKKTEKNK